MPTEDSAVIEKRRTPTLEDVARLAGVSASTVSRTLRGSDSVSPATAGKVRAAAQSLSFSIDRSASSLASGQTRRVALLVGASLGPWFSGQILDGMYGPLHDARFDLVIYRVASSVEREAFFRDLPARRNADALVVSSFLLADDEHERLEALGMPVVYVNQHREGAASVSIDDVAGARRATRHLISLGHRDLAFVAHLADDPGFVWSGTSRSAGFTAEMTHAFGPDVPAPIISVTSGPQAAEDALMQILELDPRPTGVVVTSDEIAVPLAHALRRFGFAVPEDVSVIGFDDQAVSGPVGLTTVRQPARELGERAAYLALALLAGDSDAARAVELDTRVIARSTTAPPLTPVVATGRADRVGRRRGSPTEAAGPGSPT